MLNIRVERNIGSSGFCFTKCFVWFQSIVLTRMVSFTSNAFICSRTRLCFYRFPAPPPCTVAHLRGQQITIALLPFISSSGRWSCPRVTGLQIVGCLKNGGINACIFYLCHALHQWSLNGVFSSVASPQQPQSRTALQPVAYFAAGKNNPYSLQCDAIALEISLFLMRVYCYYFAMGRKN